MNFFEHNTNQMNKDTLKIVCSYLDVDDICKLRVVNQQFYHWIPDCVFDEMTKNTFSKWKSMCQNNLYHILCYKCEFVDDYKKWTISPIKKCKLLRAIVKKYTDLDKMVKRAFSNADIYLNSNRVLYATARPSDGVLLLKLREFDGVKSNVDRIPMRIIFKIYGKRSTRYTEIGNVWVASKSII